MKKKTFYNHGDIDTYPANIAAIFDINHSGLLKPSMHTDFLGSNPNIINPFAHVCTSLRYSLKFHIS